MPVDHEDPIGIKKAARDSALTLINSTSSTALSLLSQQRLVNSRGPLASTVSQSRVGGDISPVNKGFLTPRAWEAFLSFSADFKSTVSAKVPNEHQAWLNSLGGDKITVREVQQLDTVEFQKVVLDHIKAIEPDGGVYAEALKSGTLKIHRAIDVPQLGYREYIYDIWKDGSHIGSAGAATLNKDFYETQRASGINQGVGSVNGQDYYITW